MTGGPDDGQVVGATQVANLTGGTAVPDSLDHAASAPHTPSGTTAPIPRLCEAVSAHIEYLKSRVRGHADSQNWRWMVQEFTLPDLLVERIVQERKVKMASIPDTTPLVHIVTYDLGPIEAGVLFPALEEKYGKFFFTTDFAEEVGIDPNTPEQPADLVKVGRVLPYAAQLLQFSKTAFRFNADHYLALLLLPREHQEFMTGFLGEAESSGALRPEPTREGNLRTLCDEIIVNLLNI